MWEELGISSGTAIIILIALYFIIKWAVKNGVKEACKDMKLKDSLKKLSTQEAQEDDDSEA